MNHSKVAFFVDGLVSYTVCRRYPFSELVFLSKIVWIFFAKKSGWKWSWVCGFCFQKRSKFFVSFRITDCCTNVLLIFSIDFLLTFFILQLQMKTEPLVWFGFFAVYENFECEIDFFQIQLKLDSNREKSTASCLKKFCIGLICFFYESMLQNESAEVTVWVLVDSAAVLLEKKEGLTYQQQKDFFFPLKFWEYFENWFFALMQFDKLEKGSVSRWKLWKLIRDDVKLLFTGAVLIMITWHFVN